MNLVQTYEVARKEMAEGQGDLIFLDSSAYCEMNHHLKFILPAATLLIQCNKNNALEVGGSNPRSAPYRLGTLPENRPLIRIW